MLRRLALALSACGLMAFACPGDPRADIEASIARSLAATRAEDIDAYMAEIPADLVLHQDDGTTTDHAALRADVLQQWSIIESTTALETVIDRFELQSDGSALVWTSGRWERVMLGRDGVSRHTVLTTQKHKETWRCKDGRWFNVDIEELGGQVWVDGTLQQ